jgi:threonine dehydrogenase-like Zn-dependent dehydrogenase
VVVEASRTLPVPDGLAPDAAVLTEPMAVGRHAVEGGKGTVAIVVGCGRVGLSINCFAGQAPSRRLARPATTSPVS